MKFLRSPGLDAPQYNAALPAEENLRRAFAALEQAYQRIRELEQGDAEESLVGSGAVVVRGHTTEMPDTHGINKDHDRRYQRVNGDLTAIGALAGTGLLARVAADSWALRTITGPAAGLTVTYGDGVAGNPSFTLANDLAALEGLGSTGIAVRTAANTWAQRTITSTCGLTVTNPGGVAGNIGIGLATDVPQFAALGLGRTRSGTSALDVLGNTVMELSDTGDIQKWACGTVEAYLYSTKDTDLQFGTDGAYPLHLFTSNQIRLTIAGTGNVSIAAGLVLAVDHIAQATGAHGIVMDHAVTCGAGLSLAADNYINCAGIGYVGYDTANTAMTLYADGADKDASLASLGGFVKIVTYPASGKGLVFAGNDYAGNAWNHGATGHTKYLTIDENGNVLVGANAT